MGENKIPHFTISISVPLDDAVGLAVLAGEVLCLLVHPLLGATYVVILAAISLALFLRQFPSMPKEDKPDDPE